MNPSRRNLPLVLLHAREAAMGHFRPILKHHGLTDQQWRVIRVLSEAAEPLEPGQIADSCKILGPSLTGILSRLTEIHLIRREWSPVDQRRQLVSLTAKGRTLVDRMVPLIDRQYQIIETAFGKETLDAIYETLDRLTALLKQDKPSVMSGYNGAPKVNALRAKRPTVVAKKRPRRAARVRLHGPSVP
jgi:homoprotocatechuate degradation regulator HpaR